MSKQSNNTGSTELRTKENVENCHFFASSVATWATTTPNRTLSQLIKLMENQGYPYNLFYLPVPYDTNYKINFYQPQVEGAVHIGVYNPKRT